MKKDKVLKHYFVVAAAVCMLGNTLPVNAAESSRQYICGMPEHTHSEGCYTESSHQICGLTENTGHHHTDACYTSSSILVCGTAESDEHTHGSSCYQTQTSLTCGLTETPGHTHTDACYETSRTLSCNMPEHTHSDSCLKDISEDNKSPEVPDDSMEPSETTESTESTESTETTEVEDTETESESEEETPEEGEQKGDPTADLEGPSIWKASVSHVKLTGYKATDLINIALSQLGNRESTRNYIVNAQGEKKGYSRYGAWYGLPYNDWCAMFVCFCMNYANIGTDQMPWSARCEFMVNALKARGKYESASSYIPHPGDLIFFDALHTGVPEHIGIVYQVNLTTDASGRKVASSITTIEGNSGDMVAIRHYSGSNPLILGYGRLEDHHDITKTIEIKDLKITAVYDENTAIPEDAELFAEEVDKEASATRIKNDSKDSLTNTESDTEANHLISTVIQAKKTKLSRINEPESVYQPCASCYRLLTNEHMNDLIHIGLKVEDTILETTDPVTYMIEYKVPNEEDVEEPVFVRMDEDDITQQALHYLLSIMKIHGSETATKEEMSTVEKLLQNHILISDDHTLKFSAEKDEYIGY